MSLTKPLFQFLSLFWPIARKMNPVIRQKPFDKMFSPAYSGKFNQAIVLPINQDIPISKSSIIPYLLLETLIEESSCRVIMKSCLCRTVEGCDTYPTDFGCLFLGEGASQIHSSMANQVSKEAAVAHIQRGIELSLSPTIIHSWFDAAVLGIDYKRMLGICFCCPCCCTLQSAIAFGPDSFRDCVKPLPGVTISIGDDCICCGACQEACAFDAIELHSPAVIVSRRCKACGRCVDACPQQAIHMDIEMDHTDIESLRESIQSRTSIN